MLPPDAKRFISTYFADSAISLVEEDDDSFDVVLANGIEIDFLKSGEWKHIETEHARIPQGVLETLPAGIGRYLDSHYREQYPVEIEKDYKVILKDEIEITMSNGAELQFNLDGSLGKLSD